jgi:hypothetical protein
MIKKRKFFKKKFTRERPEKNTGIGARSPHYHLSGFLQIPHFS